jgi:hypothetical protein
MRRLLTLLVLCAVFCAAGAALTFFYLRRPHHLPDPPALVVRMREVARLETLDVSLYKKVSFEPDPEPAATLIGDAFNWAKFALRPPHGKAIVFADVHIGLDLSKLAPASVLVHGDRVDVVLPPLQTKVELKPRDTEVIGSNLDSEQTAQLFEVAREAFEHEVTRDTALQERAKRSAERSLRALLLTLGFREVRFVPALAGANNAG